MKRWILISLSVFFLSFAVTPAFAVQTQKSENLLTELNMKFEGAVRFSFDSKTGFVRYIGSDRKNPIAIGSDHLPDNSVDAAKIFFSKYGKLFGLDNPVMSLKVMRTHSTSDGRQFVRFEQTYNNVPILGAELIVQMREGDYGVMSVTGKPVSIKKDVRGPSITGENAVEKALELVAKYHNVDQSSLKADKAKLYLYVPAILGLNVKKTYLVWKTEVTSMQLLPVRQLVLVDAETGIIALNFNQIDSAMDRRVYDNNNDSAYGLPGLGPVRDEGDPEIGITDVDDAYDYAGDTYNFYFDNHGRDSLDNAGMTLINTTRYCPDASNCPYSNAFWNGSQMVFGDGFASADDVVGHELTHGVTDFTSNLFYFMQSGAINESMSDIFGEFIDLTNGSGTDSSSVRWLLGEDIPVIGAIRNMKNPAAFGHPSRMGSSHYICGLYDNGGVHSNSGVGNKAAFLLVDGQNFNDITVSPLSGGIPMVADLFYEANSNLLTSASDYQDLANALRQAAINIGLSTADAQEVENAIAATEMEKQPAKCSAPEAPLCDFSTPAILFFDDLENTSSGNWTHAAVSGTVDEFYYPATSNPYGFDATYATSGANNIWGYNTYETADFAIAMTSDIALPAGSSYMHFKHAHDFEYFKVESLNTTYYYDGGVIEYSIDSGTTWNDAVDLITDNGYNGKITTIDTNSLGGRKAFVGNSNGYISSHLDLTSLAGQSVRFRFRIATDSMIDRYGWFIDDIRIYTCPIYDLDVTISESADPINPGDNLTYTIEVANNGPDTATGVTLTNTLPASATFVSVTPSSPTCNKSGDTLTCDLGTLNNGDTSTVTIEVTPTTTGTLVNTASVSTDKDDPNIINNSASEETYVISPITSSDSGTVLKGKIKDKIKENKDTISIRMIECTGLGNALESIESKDVYISVGTDANSVQEYAILIDGSDLIMKGKGEKVKYKYKSGLNGKHNIVLVPGKNQVIVKSKRIDITGIDNDIRTLITIGQWSCNSVVGWNKKEKMKVTIFTPIKE